MESERRKLGTAGEELAAQFLIAQGYTILVRNLKTKYGEVDLLALDHQTLVIVEVKTKTDSSYGSAVEMITATKKQKLRMLAYLTAANHKMTDYRIDVIAVDLQPPSQPKIEHYINCI